MPTSSSDEVIARRRGGSPHPPPVSDASPSETDRRVRVAGAGTAAVLCAATLLLGPAASTGQETPELSFDGYGTLGLVYSTEGRADFVWNPFRPDGPGHSETVSPDVDSRLGGQVTLRVTPDLTAVVQAVAEQNHEDEYTPHLEWAYVQYAVDPQLTVRAGRRPISAFMVSEHRKVSYANPWMRPPVELYGLSPVFAGEGIDVNYRVQLGEWSNRVEVSYGRAEESFGGGSAEANHTWSLENVLQRAAFTGRLSFSTGFLEMNVDGFESFFDAFRNFGPEGRAIADRYEVDDTPFESASAGVEYDPGPWFGMAEVGWADFNSALGEKLAGYATGGYRVGPLTPYASYSRVEALSETATAGLSLAGLPPELAQTAAQLNAGLNAFLRSTPIQQNLAVGARWDFTPGAALKAQVDFVDVLEESPGTFTNRQPGFEPGGSAQLLSLATVFVF